MCEPATIIMVVGAVVSAVQQDKNADFQSEVAQRNLDKNDQAARDVATDQASKVLKEARAKRARAAVIAEEAGISGNTVEQIDQSIQFEAADSLGTVGLNLRRGIANAGTQYGNEVGGIRGANYLNTALQIGDSYYRYQNNQPRNTGGT